MLPTDLDHNEHRSNRTPSQRILTLCTVVFFFVFGLMLLNQYVLGGVVVDMRIGNEGPEMLLRGDVGLWVPTAWYQYYWFTGKHLIGLPFAAFMVAIAYWHNWETANAQSGPSREN